MCYRDEVTYLKANITDDQVYTSYISKFKTATVLYIDDFLKGKVTESDVNIAYEIVNYRYNNNLPLIVSTEKKLSELMTFDEAIASRLIEMSKGRIIQFDEHKLNYRLYQGRN